MNVFFCFSSEALFWQSPKRPPTSLTFDFDDPMLVHLLTIHSLGYVIIIFSSSHVSFVVSMAKLFAAVYNVPYTDKVNYRTIHIMFPSS